MARAPVHPHRAYLQTSPGNTQEFEGSKGSSHSLEEPHIVTGLGFLMHPLRRVPERNLISSTAPQRMGAEMILTLRSKAPEVRADGLIEILSGTDEPKSCKVDLHTPPLNLHPASLTTLRQGSRALVWEHEERHSAFLNCQLTHLPLQCGFPGAQRCFIVD